MMGVLQKRGLGASTLATVVVIVFVGVIVLYGFSEHGGSLLRVFDFLPGFEQDDNVVSDVPALVRFDLDTGQAGWYDGVSWQKFQGAHQDFGRRRVFASVLEGSFRAGYLDAKRDASADSLRFLSFDQGVVAFLDEDNHLANSFDTVRFMNVRGTLSQGAPKQVGSLSVAHVFEKQQKQIGVDRFETVEVYAPVYTLGLNFEANDHYDSTVRQLAELKKGMDTQSRVALSRSDVLVLGGVTFEKLMETETERGVFFKDSYVDILYHAPGLGAQSVFVKLSVNKDNDRRIEDGVVYAHTLLPGAYTVVSDEATVESVQKWRDDLLDFSLTFSYFDLDAEKAVRGEYCASKDRQFLVVDLSGSGDEVWCGR